MRVTLSRKTDSCVAQADLTASSGQAVPSGSYAHDARSSIRPPANCPLKEDRDAPYDNGLSKV